MAAIVDTDVSVDTSGNIRWTGAATTNRHTVLEFINWLRDKQDDGQAAGDDILDITVDTAFDRSTDQILTLNSPFNIDDTFATHLYDGSVSQTSNGGETLYSGLRVIGPVVSGTEYLVIQNGKVLPPFWGTGINAEAAPSLVFSRHLIKSKEGGADIDGKRITVLARELGDQYRRFPVTLGTGNSVAAIGNGADIFNETADATIGGWTTITNTEGFQELDIDATGASGQEYYSQWATGSQTINDTYERSKWISQRAHVADQTGGTPTGADFIIDDGTIVGQAQSFIPPSGVGLTEKLVEARFTLKIGAGTPTGPVFAELYDSDDASPGVPTGAVLARSEDILASAITSTYEEVIFRFSMIDPSDGTSQRAGLDLTNAEYYIALRHPTGASGDYFHVQGASTDQDATMDRAEENPASTWTGSATSDLNMIVKSCPPIHDIPGERMEGISIEVGYDGETGAGVVEDDFVMWGTLVSYDTLVSGPFRPGEAVTFKTGSTLKTGGIVLYDNGTDELIVALDTPSALVLTDNDVISTVRGASETTAAVDFPAYTGDGATDLDFNTGPDEIVRTTGSWITDGFKVGHKVVVTGSASNNGTFNITTITATNLGVAETLTSELNVAATATLAAKDEDLGGGTGILLAKDDNGAIGELYLQVLTGVNPVENSRIRTDDVTADPLVDYVDATSTLNTKTLSPEFLGTSTGSNIIGAYGIGFDPTDVGSSDRFTSLDDASRVPPNNQVFTVSGLVSGEDRVLVGPRTGTSLEKGQFLLSTTLSGAAETAVVVGDGAEDGTPLSNDIPQDGSTTNTRLRIELDDGIYRRQAYTSWTTSTFTIPSTDYSGANIATSGNNVFVAFIDVLADATTETYTATYFSDRNLIVRVRDGGGTPIKTFEATAAQFLSTPQTVAAVRTTDV